MMLRSGSRVAFVMCGLVAFSLGAAAQEAARPAPAIPWALVDAGLSQLAAGDGGAAEASFGKARKADDSGLSDLLEQLTHAYVAFNLTTEPHPKRSLKANADLDYANRSFYKRHIPPAVLQGALERTRKLLKATPATGSPDLLHPLLCNLRLLARDRATDGEPVLETTSRDVGSLVPPKPVFAPLPPYTEAARKDRVQGSVVMAVVVDSEGCPLTAKVLKPLPQRQADQAEATWKWWAYQPASYEKHPVGLKYNLTFGFAVQ